MSADRLRDAIAVLRALRESPQTPAEIASATAVHWRQVYRLLGKLTELGAPIRKHGSQPAQYSLPVAALRKWLG